MKYKCYCEKNFYDLTVEEIRSMRRTQDKKLSISAFVEFYDITMEQYIERIKQLNGISLTRDERKFSWEQRQKEEEQQEENLPQEDCLFTIEKLPSVFVAALYEVDFEVVNGKRYYDAEELEKARKDIETKVERYEQIIKETSDRTAYSELKGIDLVAMRIYRGKNRRSFSKLSGMRIQEIKYYESLREKVPKYIDMMYREELQVKKRHIVQLRKIMEGKSDKVVEDRTIPKLVKLRVYRRDKGKCTSCEGKEELHFHHIKRFSDGGQHEVSNLKLLCRNCHAKEHEGEKGYHLLKSGN